MSRGSEKFHSLNTLSFVVQLTVGRKTTVELRNDSYVHGRVLDVDGFMNMVLRDVQYYHYNRAKMQRLDTVYIPNRLIRFVQVPTDVDIQHHIRNKLGSQPVPTSKATVKLSGSRQKILAIREKKRQEDLANAVRMKQESRK